MATGDFSGSSLEQLVRALRRLLQPRFVVRDVAHARAGVDDDDGRDGLLAADVEPVALERGLVQREAEQRDDEHPQREQDEVPEAELALVGFELLLEEPERREREPLRLLLHDQVQQDRQPDERGPGDQDCVHAAIVNTPARAGVSGSRGFEVPLLPEPRATIARVVRRRSGRLNDFPSQFPAVEGTEVKPENKWEWEGTLPIREQLSYDRHGG